MAAQAAAFIESVLANDVGRTLETWEGWYFTFTVNVSEADN